MSANDESREGIRGTGLPDDAQAPDVPPNSDPFGADGIRGDGLADGAQAPQHDSPGDADEGGIRGEDLATDA